MASGWTDEDYKLLRGQERWSAIQKRYKLLTYDDASTRSDDCIFSKEEIKSQRNLSNAASNMLSGDLGEHSSADLTFFSGNSFRAPVVFTVSRQRRPGTSHGRGGRPRLGAHHDRAVRLVSTLCNAMKRYAEAICAHQRVEDVLANTLR